MTFFLHLLSTNLQEQEVNNLIFILQWCIYNNFFFKSKQNSSQLEEETVQAAAINEKLCLVVVAKTPNHHTTSFTNEGKVIWLVQIGTMYSKGIKYAGI